MTIMVSSITEVFIKGEVKMATDMNIILVGQTNTPRLLHLQNLLGR